jgi:hypothetical protein
MIHDIKVFNPKGELVNIINGQKLHNTKYLEIAKSFSKTVWGKHAIQHKTHVTCVICKKEVQGRKNQATCGSDKCIRTRTQLKKHPKSFRTFKCSECKKEIKTYHHNKKTCGSQECFVKNRIKGEKLRIQKLKEKKDGSQKNSKRSKKRYT